MKTYDLIVVGTGGAGYQVAMTCRQAGWEVAAIDRGPFGGTCSVRGCIPKKVLSGTAEIAATTQRLNEKGVLSPAKIDWTKLIEFKKSFTEPVPPETVEDLEAAGIDVYTGMPQFTGENELEVNGETLQADKIHLATGLEPAHLPIEGFEYLVSSDQFLELATLPERIVFVGAGYISFEFAHVAAACGAKVTLLHNDSAPLPMFDADIVQQLCDASRDAGITIELNAAAEAISKEGKEYIVTAANGKTYEADLVVHGAGRVPSIDGMNLEAANIVYDKRRGIEVNDSLRSTSNPRVTAAGDVADAGPQLSPVARIQGSIVADNLLGGSRVQPSYLSTPSVAFTSPTTATVGYQEDEAREHGYDFTTKTTDLSDWFDSKRLNIRHAMSKVLIERETNKILGAHLICHGAEDLINIFSLAIENDLTADQLKQPILAFPTVSDDLRSML